MMYPLRHSLLASVVVLVVAGSLAAGCSNTVTSEAGAVATAGNGPAAIGIETSSVYVTVVNNAGAPIEDVRVAIQPVGNPMQFTSLVRRLENGEKRDISLSDFRGNDGTTFTPRIYRPRQVTVTATDIVGKKHERTVAWGR